ncbi:MAG: DUF1080 domain-containing protein [Bacteroidetes bacterium]|nr:DUF1080 domain-containing protein [Bacteroidota bacterium]
MKPTKKINLIAMLLHGKTTDGWKNFILKWDWKLGAHGNSGKWDAFPDYGFARKGKICLQDHGSKIWFRNVKIKEL